jgi:peptidoglycan/xylan/chitin deacetylase (PgdA/CDA1 family)
MLPTPRVLLSIDYEPWFALFRRYDRVMDSNERRDLDAGFTLHALDPIFEQLGESKASIYLVGEIADWYPHIPQKIVSAGHELGLHCHTHRSLKNEKDLAKDLLSSSHWIKQYRVRGYRAPMVGISEAAYPLLEENGFLYSSSIYAPTGVLLKK